MKVNFSSAQGLKILAVFILIGPIAYSLYAYRAGENISDLLTMLALIAIEIGLLVSIFSKRVQGDSK